MSKNNKSIGDSGEHFVAAELERHGFSVGMPMSRTEYFDILAMNRTTKKCVAIQVKTSSGTKPKNEQISDDQLFYVFVLLNDQSAPSYYVVPSRYVACKIASIHKAWLAKGRRDGTPHKSTSMRNFILDATDINRFCDGWNQLQ